MASSLTRRQKTIIASVASGAETGALILSFSDSDDIGPDDDIAGVIRIVANQFRKIAAMTQPLNRDAILKLIAEGLLEEVSEEPSE